MRLLSLLLVWLLMALPVRAEDIEIGLSNETIAITSNFSGTDIAVFGAIEEPDAELLQSGAYDVVVVLEGPPEDVVIRRKERRLGIWVNGASETFRNVPSFYSVASTRPLEDISDAANRKMLELGFDNRIVRPVEAQLNPTQPNDPFRTSLARLRESEQLFAERANAVQFLSPTLFRARLRVPANVPIGVHRARAYLFRNGEFVITRSTLLEVAKTGFEQATYNLAHRNGLLYGILAVFIAMFTGWAASVIFSKD